MFKNFFGGFRDFIMRGNVVELAIGVVIGVAFNNLVTRFTDDFIQPLLNAAGGGKGEFKGAWRIFGGQHLGWADFVNTVINFLIVAAVIYFLLVLPMNKIEERRRRNQPQSEPSIPEDIELLRQIRDSLATLATAPATVGSPATFPTVAGPAKAADAAAPVQRTGRRRAPEQDGTQDVTGQ